MATRRKAVATVVAVVNPKGGVGKTTVVLELSQALLRAGFRVLAIDSDPQGDLTEALAPAMPTTTLSDVLTGDRTGGGEVAEGSLHWAVEASDSQWNGVEFVAASPALTNREHDQVPHRTERLAVAMQGELARWDWVLIDCPGSLSELTAAALVAADRVLVVTEPRKASVEAIAAIADTVMSIRRSASSTVQLAGIIVNRMDPRLSDPQFWLEQLQADYGELVLTPAIEAREVVPRAYTERMPLAHYGAAAADLTAEFDRIAAELVSARRRGRI